MFAPDLVAEELDPFCLSLGLSVTRGTHPSSLPIDSPTGATRRDSWLQ